MTLGDGGATARERLCKHCGRAFVPPLETEMQRRLAEKRIFCRRECQVAFRRQKEQAAYEAAHGPVPEKPCARCGKRFRAYNRNPRLRFCSRKCIERDKGERKKTRRSTDKRALCARKKMSLPKPPDRCPRCHAPACRQGPLVYCSARCGWDCLLKRTPKPKEPPMKEDLDLDEDDLDDAPSEEEADEEEEEDDSPAPAPRRRPLTSQAQGKETAREVLAALSSEGSTPPEVARATGKPRSTIARALRRLVEEGQASEHNGRYAPARGKAKAAPPKKPARKATPRRRSSRSVLAPLPAREEPSNEAAVCAAILALSPGERNRVLDRLSPLLLARAELARQQRAVDEALAALRPRGPGCLRAAARACPAPRRGTGPCTRRPRRPGGRTGRRGRPRRRRRER